MTQQQEKPSDCPIEGTLTGAMAEKPMAPDAFAAAIETVKQSLDLSGSPKDTRIAVAMSGGVDSSVTAALMVHLGYDVFGVTMQLYDHGVAIEKANACCAGRDIVDARRVAARLGIPHYVVDYEGRFLDDVMNRFADSYLNGETPVPCVYCNQTVKFRDLLERARLLGAEALVTGHYVQRLPPSGTSESEGFRPPGMARGMDDSKDQSYFLFATTREQLKHVRFPLGALSKDVTRDLAHHFGLAVADKPDSQDICFVPDGDYAKVVERLRPGIVKPGDIVHVDGRVVGQHQGIIHYTIGQRRGLGIGGLNDPLYVIHLDADNAQVIVGPRESLARQTFTLSDVNWLGYGDAPPEDGMDIEIKTRNAQQPFPARVTPQGIDRLKIEAFTPNTGGIAPGQAGVLYDGMRMLGGGWICR